MPQTHLPLGRTTESLVVACQAGSLAVQSCQALTRRKQLSFASGHLQEYLVDQWG